MREWQTNLDEKTNNVEHRIDERERKRHRLEIGLTFWCTIKILSDLKSADSYLVTS